MQSCAPGFYCGKGNTNPNNGATNFDNVVFSMMQIFQVTTMTGWTDLMVHLMMSIGSWVVGYFYAIIFIGAFFLYQLVLAVIKAKFTEEMEHKHEEQLKVKGGKKKKRLDDAQETSEDDDHKAEEL